MATMKHYPKSYMEADQLLLSKKDKPQLKIGHNTYLVRHSDHIAIRYHATDIVAFYPRKTALNTGGWHTVSTKSRLNDFIFGSIYQKNYDWFYVDPKGEEFAFRDEMELSVDGYFLNY